MHTELVQNRRWISEQRFLHALNYCMLLPGPEAQQLATYLGWLMHRTWGGIVAGALFGFVTSFGNLEMSLFLCGPGRTTLPIVVLQYLEWKIDPTIAAVSVVQIVLIGIAMLITDRYVKLARVV